MTQWRGDVCSVEMATRGCASIWNLTRMIAPDRDGENVPAFIAAIWCVLA